MTVAPFDSYLIGLCWLELGYGGVLEAILDLWSMVLGEGKTRMQPLFKQPSCSIGIGVY